MSATAQKIVQLRQLLAERHRVAAQSAAESAFVTGLPALDEIGLPQGALVEIVTSLGEGPGGSLLLHGLLRAYLGSGRRAVLVDGRNAFSPLGLPPSELTRLLWTRCHTAGEALKAADLVVRDGNLPLVIVLLTLNRPTELRQISTNAWHRLQMLAEKSGVTLLAFTPQAQIGCARLRLAVGGAFPLAKLSFTPARLMPEVEVRVERRRIGNERRSDRENVSRLACA